MILRPENTRGKIASGAPLENARTGRARWLRAVRGGWRKEVPHAEREHLPLTSEVLAAHLSRQAHIGPYPLLDASGRWVRQRAAAVRDHCP